VRSSKLHSKLDLIIELGGFAQRLAYVYARKLDVINRGLSGYNSDWAIPVFEEARKIG
jgi:hypothetical protein